MQKMMVEGKITSVDVMYNGITTLGHKALKSKIEDMKWLLTRQPPANVNFKNSSGETILLKAVLQNNVNVVRTLLEYGADRNIKDNDGDTPVTVAQIYGYKEVARALNTYSPLSKVSQAYRDAIKPDNVASKPDSDVFIKQFHGEDIAGMQKMMDEGQITTVDVIANDMSTLAYKAINSKIEDMKWLLTRQPPADINLRNSNGFTALFLATQLNKVDSVRTLLEYGADRNIKNNNDKTPLDYAILFKKKDMIPILQTYFPDKKGGKKLNRRTRRKIRKR